MPDKNTIQDRPPNFREDGKLYLVRCYTDMCKGRENWAMTVAKGRCAWCGWSEDTERERVAPKAQQE